MGDLLILAAALPLLAGLLWFERRASTRGLLLTKPFLSLLFVTVALAGPAGDPLYQPLILAGLLACLAGDICLIFFDRPRIFLAGLAAFLVGHLFYVVAFFSLARPAWPGAIGTAVLLLLSGATFLWLRPRLGSMLVPVAAYVAVITAMVVGAMALMANEGRPATGRSLALTGALLFYLSDLFVARQRFVGSAYLNRLLGLPLYYGAQFLIAFSIRWL